MTDLRLYTSAEELPELMEGSYFHSREFFRLCEAAPRLHPLLVVGSDAQGELCHMVAIVRSRTSWLPSCLSRHCLVMEEGVYSRRTDSTSAGSDAATSGGTPTREQLFGQMIDALQQHLGHGYLYIEVSHLGQKMFGYREFRQRGYFPVRWQSITNSLHSRPPEQRLDRRTIGRINKGLQRGAKTTEVSTREDMDQFMRLMRKHTMLKPRRFLPTREFFEGLQQQGNCRLFLTRYNGTAIGCSTTVYSGQHAYFWYAAYRRKSYAFLYPQLLTVWHALTDAHRRRYRYFTFIDVGLPYSHSAQREMILRFGGKPQSTFRWFRCSIGWVNRLLSLIYRD